MTKTEDNFWHLIVGVLMGMVLAFWFMLDVDFYRNVWPIIMGVVVLWALVRGEPKEQKNGKREAAKNGGK